MIFAIMSAIAMAICYWFNTPWYGYVVAELIVVAIRFGGDLDIGDCDFGDFGGGD